MKVSKVNNSIKNGQIITEFGFITYTWSFPEYFSGRINDGRCPRIKAGYHYNYYDNGETRMKQACSSKTSNAEQPFQIIEGLQQWIIPTSISESNPNAAEKFATQFDKKCNKVLGKYRNSERNQKLKGEEWYDIHIEKVKEIRTFVFVKLVAEYGAKVEETELKPILLDRGNKKVGLQKMIVNHIVEDFLPSESFRAKGIAPTGLGKTVCAWFAITRAFEKELLPNRIAIFTAPTQFLAEKNCIAFRTYGIRNDVNMINIPIYSGSDVIIDTGVKNMEDRKETLKSVIRGYLTDSNANITLHVCSHSMRLLDQALSEIEISQVDFAIIDEAHTMASVRNNNVNYVLHDGHVKINKRLFITATEKTLVNPNNLQDGMTDNYMSNENVYGNYLFQYSYADGVANKHILPFTCHVFEYSDRNLGVVNMLTSLKEMQIEELSGLFDDEFSISPKMAQSIISSIKIMEEKKRNKLLILCSRNNHAKLLSVVLQHIQRTSNKLDGINIRSVTADEYDVQDRADAIEAIDESEEKEIVITGPWAVTGVDCPSLDAVLWNFTPSSEISAAQGIGRGSRIAGKNKEYLMVFFNLDLGLSIHEIQNTLTSTIQKIYEAQFPSHNVVVRDRVRRILGRRFLGVDRTESDTIELPVRILLNDIYEAAATISLTDHILNLKFLPGYHVFRYRSTQEEIEILKNKFETVYDSNLLYDKEELLKEILKSDNFKNLISVELSWGHVAKLIASVSPKYNIQGKYSGYYDQVKFIIENIVINLINAHKINFLGINIVDINLINTALEKSLNKELDKKIYNRKYDWTLVAKDFAKPSSMHLLHTKHKILIPIVGGKSKAGKEIIRPALYAEALKRCSLTGLSSLIYYEDFKKCISDILNEPKHLFLKKAWGDRSMKEEWTTYLKDNLDDNEFKNHVYKSMMARKRKKYGDDLSGVIKGVWDEAKREQSRLRLIQRNKNGQAKLASDTANKAYVTCPDGHITTRPSATTYCKNRGLDRSKCIPVK